MNGTEIDIENLQLIGDTIVMDGALGEVNRLAIGGVCEYKIGTFGLKIGSISVSITHRHIQTSREWAHG